VKGYTEGHGNHRLKVEPAVASESPEDDEELLNAVIAGDGDKLTYGYQHWNRYYV
jgi:hypothetical protein